MYYTFKSLPWVGVKNILTKWKSSRKDKIITMVNIDHPIFKVPSLSTMYDNVCLNGTAVSRSYPI